MIVVFISVRNYGQDFRKFLLEALRADGHECWHVKVGRSNTLTGANGTEDFRGIGGLFGLIRRLREIGARGTVIYVDTTGAIMPIRSLLFRLALRTGVWCFDAYDNLVYNYAGLRLLKMRAAIRLLARSSDLVILLSRESLRNFPGGYHLDNAWDIPRLRRDEASFRDFIALSAIDARFDFDFVEEVARLSPERRTVIHGFVLHDDPAIARRLSELCARHRNVVFNGRYAFDDVPAIVAGFGIALTPYVAGTTMTEFINPDKYYLFLQAGLEVVSTEIPQARRMEKQIHVARTPQDAVEIARRIEEEPAFRKNADWDADFTWAKRAGDFIDIVRTATLSKGASIEERAAARQSNSLARSAPADRRPVTLSHGPKGD